MSRLSGREQAVWDKRNAGLTFKQIAKDLGLCPATVSFAYRKAYRKIEYEKERFINTADNERLKVIAELEEWVEEELYRYTITHSEDDGTELWLMGKNKSLTDLNQKLNEMKGGGVNDN